MSGGEITCETGMLSWVTLTNCIDANCVYEGEKAFEQTNRKFISGILYNQSRSQ